MSLKRLETILSIHSSLHLAIWRKCRAYSSGLWMRQKGFWEKNAEKIYVHPDDRQEYLEGSVKEKMAEKIQEMYRNYR